MLKSGKQGLTAFGSPSLRTIWHRREDRRLGADRDNRSLIWRRQFGPARRKQACRASERFPFRQEDYHKCILQVASQGVAGSYPGPTNGHLIFLLESDIPKNADGTYGRMDASIYRDRKALLMQIGGDSFHMILALLEGRRDRRPFALDLLWTVLGRGQEVSKKEWKLLHVAVVAIEDTTYVARLFFGDGETKNIVWDCDSRPSDACWLALKAKCPIYMHKKIWESNAQTLLDMIRSGEQLSRNTPSAIEVSANSIRPSDPEPVKRLKREMEVAISEEDYTTAARIRDHPYMKLFSEISALEKSNNREKAEELRAELDKLIEGRAKAFSVRPFQEEVHQHADTHKRSPIN